MILWKKEFTITAILIVFVSLLGWLAYFLSDSQPSELSEAEILQQYRITQSKNDEVIQNNKALMFESCTMYKQAQVNNKNIENKIIVVSNSKYSEKEQIPKEIKMDTNEYCRKLVDIMSFTFKLDDFSKALNKVTAFTQDQPKSQNLQIQKSQIKEKKIEKSGE